jgi:alpha-beta hydrolase superfamily lysophospholipase
MRFQAGYFRSRDGQDLFFRQWRPLAELKGALLLVHGLGEHSGRYEEFAAAANRHGFAVFAMDNRGHGRSAGKRGHVDRFHRFVEDLEVFWLRFGPRGEVPAFLVGQSLGALIALHFVGSQPKEFEGVVFCSGAFALPDRIPRIKLLAGKLLRRIAPATTMSHGLPIQCLSTEPEVIQAYLDDPFVHDRISVQLFFEMSEAMAVAPTLAARLTLPALFLQGAADCMVPMSGARAVYEAWSGRGKEFMVLEGEGHDLFHGASLSKTCDILFPWLHRIMPHRTIITEEARR